MVQRFIAWWTRNSAYIGPLATCVSALAALLSVYIVTKTFRQARKDRKEEREAKHPRFKVLGGAAEWITHIDGDHTITPYYELWVVLQNVREHSAFRVKIQGAICPDITSTPIMIFTREPTDDIESASTVEARTKLSLPRSDHPYYLELKVAYRDRRTNERYNQTLYRKFFLQGDDQTRPFLDVDKSEIRDSQSPKLVNG